MPAPRTKPGALLPALLLVAACASNRPEHAAPAAKPSSEATLEDLAPAPAPPVHTEIDQLDESLAAYEQQLAHNESRLRAMGVRLAAAERVQADPDDEAPHDDRFAAPPPAKAGDARRARDEKAEPRAKSTTTKTASAPAPTPRPAPQATATAPGRATGHAAKPTEPEAQASAEDRDAGAGHCAELCDLAHATCELEAKICALAQRHTEDPRYGEVCRRAGEDCDLASEACKQCSP